MPTSPTADFLQPDGVVYPVSGRWDLARPLPAGDLDGDGVGDLLIGSAYHDWTGEGDYVWGVGKLVLGPIVGQLRRDSVRRLYPPGPATYAVLIDGDGGLGGGPA